MLRYRTCSVSALGNQVKILQLRQHSHGHTHSHGHSHGHGHGAAQVFWGSGKQEMGGGAGGEDHARMCRRVTIAGGLTNCVFAVVKMGLGSAEGGSRALLADGMHAAVDLCADIVSFIAVSTRRWHFSKCRWPYGPGRVETVASLVISLLLVSGSFVILQSTLFALWTDVAPLLGINMPEEEEVPKCSSAQEHTHSHSHGGCSGGGHGHSHFDAKSAYLLATAEGADGENSEAKSKQRSMFYFMIAASLSSLVAKECLYRWGRRVGERAGSAVVVANAMHHRADAWSSGVALCGVAGVAAGLPFVDQVAAITVSSAVLRVGCQMSMKAGQEILGFQPVEYERRSGSVNRCVSLDQHNTLKAVMVNVGVIRHGHTLRVNGLLVVPPAASSLQVANAAKELESRFTTEFECCCPDIELHYQLLAVDPATSQASVSDELLTAVATYHRLDALKEKVDSLRTKKQEVMMEGKSSCSSCEASSPVKESEGYCPICGDSLSELRPCLRDLEAIRYYYTLA